MECTEINWLYKHKKKVKSSQAPILINSCTELSKTQLFPIVYKKTDDWIIEWQRVTTNSTTSDNKWQRVTKNDNEWQRMTTSGHFG